MVLVLVLVLAVLVLVVLVVLELEFVVPVPELELELELAFDGVGMLEQDTCPILKKTPTPTQTQTQHLDLPHVLRILKILRQRYSKILNLSSSSMMKTEVHYRWGVG